MSKENSGSVFWDYFKKEIEKAKNQLKLDESILFHALCGDENSQMMAVDIIKNNDCVYLTNEIGNSKILNKILELFKITKSEVLKISILDILFFEMGEKHIFDFVMDISKNNHNEIIRNKAKEIMDEERKFLEFMKK